MSNRTKGSLSRLRQALLNHIISRPALHAYCAGSHEDGKQFGTRMWLRHLHASGPSSQFCSGDEALILKQRLVELCASGGLDASS